LVGILGEERFDGARITLLACRDVAANHVANCGFVTARSHLLRRASGHACQREGNHDHSHKFSRVDRCTNLSRLRLVAEPIHRWPAICSAATPAAPEGMMRIVRVVLLATLSVVVLSRAAGAQTGTPAPSADNDWRITAYPVLAWVPLSIDVDVNIPPFGGDSGGAGDIVESQFDGAFFAGVSASNRVWRADFYGLWASFGGDRPERPFLSVDLDLIYGSGRLGRRVAPDLYVTGGVRRVAIDYDITLGSLPRFARKPGVWDPIVGLGWHHERNKVEWHAALDGGGFGVGADVDLGGSFSVDWKPISHFGLTAGYNFLYLKVTDSVATRDVILKMTVHGPTVGLGLYF
jgi:hypothetical protein